MVSAALVISYLFLVLAAVLILVLLCLGCGCHVPLGKCVRCFCDNTTRCCGNLCPGKKRGEAPKSVVDAEAGAKPKAATTPGATGEGGCAECSAGCLKWVPWALSCGFCCGAFKEGSSKPPRGSMPTVVGQPVNSTGARGVGAIDIDEVIGTDYVVATRIPLLSIG